MNSADNVKAFPNLARYPFAEYCRKSGKQIERCLISKFRVAESIGFKGEFRVQKLVDSVVAPYSKNEYFEMTKCRAFSGSTSLNP
jgi:hypothetical protein